MSSTRSASVNPPKQPRSRKTLERIVDAALQLLEQEGPEGLTVKAVVARARSSVGSFYARFGGKEDLLDYLSERVWDEALERWRASVESKAWSGMTLAEIAAGAAGLLIDVRQHRVGLLRDLGRMGGDGHAHDRFRSRLVESLETLLLEREQEMTHRNPELAVRLGLNAVLGMIDGGLPAASQAEAGSDAARDLMAQECSELLLGYLTGGAMGRSGPVEFFDVWG